MLAHFVLCRQPPPSHWLQARMQPALFPPVMPWRASLAMVAPFTLARSKNQLVARPSNSLSDDSAFQIGIGPADGAGALGVGADISH